MEYKDVQEDHRIWRYNTILLYDLMMCHTLEWPSLTVDWIEGLSSSSGEEVHQRMLLGTHTSGCQNYLYVYDVCLPYGVGTKQLAYQDHADYSGFGFGEVGQKKFAISRCIPHDGEVNRALALPRRGLHGAYPVKHEEEGDNLLPRSHPEGETLISDQIINPIVATKSIHGHVYIYDTSKGTSQVDPNRKPDKILVGHKLEGWGVAFNPVSPHLLASSADDGTICVWDIQGNSEQRNSKNLKISAKQTSAKQKNLPKQNDGENNNDNPSKMINPSKIMNERTKKLNSKNEKKGDISEPILQEKTTYKKGCWKNVENIHTGDSTLNSTQETIAPLHFFDTNQKPVQDVVWRDTNTILSAGDAGQVCIYDLRVRTPVSTTQVSNLELNALAINHFNNDIIALGGADSDISLFSLKNLKYPLHKMSLHQAAIVRLHFAPYSEKLLASASTDMFVGIWDIDKIGLEQSPDDVEDGPPELNLLHGGHTGSVSDFSWNPENPYRWVVASVAEDNVLQIWQPSQSTFEDADESDSDEVDCSLLE